MNIYCGKCKKELEIEEDLGSVIIVYWHYCDDKDPCKCKKYLKGKEYVVEVKKECPVHGAAL